MNLETRIEQTGNGFSAYVVGLPGCVAAAETREDTQQLIDEAIIFHLEGLMLRKSLVAIVPIDIRTESATVWTTENSPMLFVDIDAPFLTAVGVVSPKIETEVGLIGAAA